MSDRRFDGPYELPDGVAGEPFEEDGLDQRTDFQSRAPRSGADFKAMAIARLTEAGARVERLAFEIDDFPVDALVVGPNGSRFLVLARGTPDEQERGALRRTDTVEKAGYMAMQLARCQDLPILMITSDMPERTCKAGRYLAALSEYVWDVVSFRADLRGFQRLRQHFCGPPDAVRPSAPWRAPLSQPPGELFDAAGEISTAAEVALDTGTDPPLQGGPPADA